LQWISFSRGCFAGRAQAEEPLSHKHVRPKGKALLVLCDPVSHSLILLALGSQFLPYDSNTIYGAATVILSFRYRSTLWSHLSSHAQPYQFRISYGRDGMHAMSSSAFLQQLACVFDSKSHTL